MDTSSMPLGRLLAVTARMLGAKMQRLLDEQGLTHAGWIVLQRVAQEDGPSLRDLADSCFVSAASVTGVVDTLEREGLVERHRTESDRRVVRLFLTDAGRERVAAAKRLVQREMRPVFADLPRSDELVVRRFLDGILDRLAAEETA